MTIYCGITDETTGCRWSRNSWRTTTACPDLYISKKNAQKQIDTGKISIMMKYLPNLRPVIVYYDLEEI